VRRILAAIALAAALAAVPGIAAAQSGGVSGLLVRVQGDVLVGAGESADLVVVVSGDAEVRGRAAAVVVVGGTARLAGARVGHLVVVRGTAVLDRGTVVEGDVWLAWARLDQAPGATVEGTVRRGVARFGWGWLAISPLLSVGLGLLAAGAGLLAVALAPRRTKQAAANLTGDFLGALTWALVLFAVMPALAMLAFFTVVGLPAALVVLALVLPVLFLAGFAVAGLRLGMWVLRSRGERPYGAAALGCALLLATGLIPVAGLILVAVAAALGSGALARTFGREGGLPETGPEEAVEPASGPVPAAEETGPGEGAAAAEAEPAGTPLPRADGGPA
jgi:hypothetical protein